MVFDPTDTFFSSDDACLNVASDFPGHETDKAQEKTLLKALKSQLAKLQQPLRESNIGVVVLFEGFSVSGKGRLIADVISELDPRGYTVHSTTPPPIEEQALPFLAPFWKAIPSHGEMAIFHRSWYGRILTLPKEEQEAALESVRIFERQLSDDGYLIIKCFLHISKKEQAKRLEELEKNPATSWRVTDKDWLQNRNHDQYLQQMQDLMQQAHLPYAPWHTIKTKHPRHGTIQVLSSLCSEISTAISQGLPTGHCGPHRFVQTLSMPALSDVPLNAKMDEHLYKTALKEERQRLQDLHSLLYREKIPVVLAFEGWDAAGKGGAIRRLSWALDPRGFNVIPIAAPSREELDHHYLWRFWNKLPKNGHIAIFDRTWYGRVMVERLEGFAKPHRWQAAFQEINEFEADLTNWGAIVLKFWIQIDKDEQLQRFTQRQNTPEKQYKLTDEDWRNREKWDVYEEAINEMLQRTSTPQAPWIIVEGNDKRFARLKVLRTVRQALEQRLHPL